MNTLRRGALAFVGLNGAMAVAAGAYAQHALAGVEPGQGWMRLASQFQLWHALALALVLVLKGRADGAAGLALTLAGGLFALGLALFCGTLYALALSAPPPLAMTAPMGGGALILGWIALAASAPLPGWRGGN